ncbi:unnamed protein product, partial [Mesorhabditis belari]|uniref:Uncharacterized protein n=1 Tax=Mesorhabditis belari TaxID=2138241 RepID=A0AAF3ED40_9BILA
MLGSIRDTLLTVQNELSNGVERLRVNVTPTLAVQRCPVETINELVNTSAGSDLLLKYQTQLDQMQTVSDEGVRLANLCSTRLGRAQQMCRERADAVLNIDTFLRSIQDVDKRIREIGKQVEKLQRFCDQTELAFAHLEGLCMVVRAEEEVELIRERARVVASLVPPVTPPPSVFPPPAVQASDTVRAQQEEVMLEEFLSKP